MRPSSGSQTQYSTNRKSGVKSLRDSLLFDFDLKHQAKIAELEKLSPLARLAVSQYGAQVVKIEPLSPLKNGVPSDGFIDLTLNEDKAKSPQKLDINCEAISPEEQAVYEALQRDRFLSWKSELGARVILLIHREKVGSALLVKPSHSSRYFSQGRRRIQAKIRRQLGRWWNSPGLLITLTFDPKLISLVDAWHDVGRLRREFLNRVNRWRVRHAMSRLKCLSVLEEQPGTGYPHVHLVFPGLRYIAPIAFLTQTWAQAENSVDLKYRDSLSPVNYVCKYVSKLEGWSDYAQSYLWANGTRLYSLSRDYRMPDYSAKRVASWQYYRVLDIPSLPYYLTPSADYPGGQWHEAFPDLQGLDKLALN